MTLTLNDCYVFQIICVYLVELSLIELHSDSILILYLLIGIKLLGT